MTVNGKQVTDADNWILSNLCAAVMYGDEHPGFLPEGAREQYLDMAKKIIERIKRNGEMDDKR